MKICNSKIGAYLITIGGGFAVIGLILSLIVFGITFGTGCLMVSGVFFIIYGITFRTTKNPRLNIKLLLLRRLLSGLLLIAVASFITIESLIFQSLKSNDKTEVQYAVILGAGVKGEEPSATLRRRLDTSIDYLNKNPDTKIIASGGLGKEATLTEAEVMKRYFIAHGIDESRILKEEKSTTSDENLKYTKELLTGLYDEDVPEMLIITSDYHMFRAKRIAEKYYTKVYGISSATPSTVMMNYAIREYLAVLKMLMLEIGK
ncbi:YdcF family protein [Anaerosinus massiliensis]|uniref:YdcF family protein n=1 Tax=Massilibacillus massiliensis TaxID=1806837 RepID=UPI000DA5F157|nr:YdcF family protein [Massilibacillus massiliensis]